MTIRLGHKRRPPFLFSQRARPVNIPCEPVISRRSPSDTYFAELVTAIGPQAIGDTGDNTFQHLFGRQWLVVWCDNDHKLHAFQEDAATRGVWHAVTTPLPPVFDSPLPETARRVSFAFDQSARMIVAYEDDGVVKVTRWDTTTNSYVQNVTFAGRDPAVIMDAAWAYDIPNSDALLFYLSTDRTKVLCRVQRELYAVENEMWEYEDPVVLDRVIPTFLRYQLLVGTAGGRRQGSMLLSDPYPYLGMESVTGVAALTGSGAYVDVVLNSSGEDVIIGAAAFTASGAYVDAVIDVTAPQHVLEAAAAFTASGAYVDAILDTAGQEVIAAAAVAASGGQYVLVVINAPPGGESMTGAATGPSGGTYAAA